MIPILKCSLLYGSLHLDPRFGDWVPITQFSRNHHKAVYTKAIVKPLRGKTVYNNRLESAQ